MAKIVGKNLVMKVSINKRTGAGSVKTPGTTADWHCLEGRWNQGGSCSGGRFKKDEIVNFAHTLLKDVKKR